MSKEKSKKIISRILAVLLVITLVFDCNFMRATTDLRAVLNGGKKHDGTTEVSDEDAKVNKLSNAKNIKLVKKKYISVYNKDSTLTCNDKLWLLA